MVILRNPFLYPLLSCKSKRVLTTGAYYRTFYANAVMVNLFPYHWLAISDYAYKIYTFVQRSRKKSEFFLFYPDFVYPNLP